MVCIVHLACNCADPWLGHIFLQGGMLPGLTVPYCKWVGDSPSGLEIIGHGLGCICRTWGLLECFAVLQQLANCRGDEISSARMCATQALHLLWLRRALGCGFRVEGLGS